MDHCRQALLFCPPQPPLRLERDRSVVIGRHRSCELPLRTGNVSRRHAEVRVDGTGYVLKDLNSTNGTFVNGQRLEGEHRLNPGDRIEISSCVVTFCEIEADDVSSEGSNEPTLLFERPAVREALSGDLEEIPPFALLQVLEMGCKSGLLEIESEGGIGRMWLVDGAPVHAETEKGIGFDAALDAVSGHSGHFRFQPGVAPPERTVQASVTELLLEASRRLDEARDPGANL